ncbi:SapC family protein [Motiliproteus sp. MSK22-1]|uniref:SapC family protein n=1 Tax=Motiliproteus sp. MSK22-1 TaxID=1897630 RepID=UPI00097705A2|nr:SapC family protein [Motiliproteus sp. MSK22-1]OMH30396.1 hypothetical protein BGP75_18645 [Motiliproteus sp. MSK22-1]
MSESLTALSPEAHNRLRFDPKADFGFAQKTHICPLLITEVSKAARNYPVVFPAGKGVIVPQVMFSVKPNANPSVSEDGSWQGGYIPLHLRRYPFFLGREKDADKAVVLFDQSAPQIGEEGKLLYNKRGDNYVASPVLKQIKESLVGFDQEYQKTRAICGLLQKAGVLKAGKLDVLANGKKQTIRGFSVVDWDLVTKLDDATLANWARIGLIQLIHTHLQSINEHFRAPASAPKPEK